MDLIKMITNMQHSTVGKLYIIMGTNKPLNTIYKFVCHGLPTHPSSWTEQGLPYCPSLPWLVFQLL